MPAATPAAPSAPRDLLERGRLAFARGRPGESRRLLLRALDQVGDVGSPADGRLRAQLLISLGLAEFELQGQAEAMARLHSAEELIERYALTALRSAVHNQRGIFQLRLGAPDAALAEFDAGVAVPGHDGVEDRCKILVNRATVHMDRGAMGAARADLQRCIRQAGRAGLPLLEVMATHNLGYVEFLTGNLPTALQLMDDAFAMDPTVSPGVARLDKASVLVEAGLLREAADTLQSSASLFARQRMTFDVAIAQLEQARCALALGEPAAARRLAAAAREHSRRRGNERARRAAELVVLQAELATGRRLRRVGAAALELRTEFDTDGLRLPGRMAALIAAEAVLGAGAPDAARAILAELGPVRRDDPITGRLYSHYVDARVDAADGAVGPAAARVRRALRELADYQARFGSIDLRTASAVHGRRLVEFDTGLALATGRAGAVFAAIERGRAVSSRLPPVRPPDDPVAGELLADLRQTIDLLRGVEQDPAASTPLLARRRDLEHQIVARTWTVAGSGSAARAAALGEVRAALGPRTLVSFVQSRTQLWAVLLSGSRPRLIDLGPVAPVLEWIRRGRADLDVLARSGLPGGIRGAVRAALQRSLDGLDATLLAPLALDGGPLVVVSTGLLGQVPWGSLPSLRGVPVVVAPSATKWLACARPVTPARRGGVVAIAGPDLIGADVEAGAVGAVWAGGTALTHADATRERFAAALGSARVLHVAAHGVHQPDNPLFSSLRLADGPIFAHELDSLMGAATAPEHVVLSACEVGLATVRPGDEALGLASVLLQLGTRSVVAGLARVADDVTADTMAAYHRELAGGADSATALAAALAGVAADVAPPFVTFGGAWTA